MKCHVFTGEGLPIGWVKVQSTQPLLSFVTPFHPNACYWLIRPKLLLFRWPADVGIGHFADDEQEWQDFGRARAAIESLNFYFQVAGTGKRIEISCHCIEEVNGAYTFHGFFSETRRY